MNTAWAVPDRYRLLIRIDQLRNYLRAVSVESGSLALQGFLERYESKLYGSVCAGWSLLVGDLCFVNMCWSSWSRIGER